MMITEITEEINNLKADFYVNHIHLNTLETTVHQHSKGQLIYAEGGIIHIFIEAKHWYLPARCFMWIPALTKHSILSHSNRGDLYNLYFKKEDKENSFFEATNIYFANDLLREMILHTAKWHGPILQSTSSQYYFLKAIKEILPEIESTKLPIMMQHPFPKDAKLYEISMYLNNNLENNFTIEEIALKFGLSTRTLSRKFKENLGMNYVRFLRSLRITKAFQLIAEQRYSMYEIALMVGYSSLTAFSNIFLEISGIRPTEYAKLLRNSDDKKNI